MKHQTKRRTLIPTHYRSLSKLIKQFMFIHFPPNNKRDSDTVRIAHLTKGKFVTSIGLSSFSLLGSLIPTSRFMLLISNTLIQ